MEILFGFVGLVGIALLAIAFGADLRDVIGDRFRKVAPNAAADDPHSTLSVTRQVLSELGEREACR